MSVDAASDALVQAIGSNRADIVTARLHACLGAQIITWPVAVLSELGSGSKPMLQAALDVLKARRCRHRESITQRRTRRRTLCSGRRCIWPW